MFSLFRRGSDDKTALTTLQDRVTAMERDMADWRKWCMRLDDDLANLTDKHVRLRGKVYATGKHRMDDDEAAPKPSTAESRDDLRRKLIAGGRWMPGKPAQHDD